MLTVPQGPWVGTQQNPPEGRRHFTARVPVQGCGEMPGRYTQPTDRQLRLGAGQSDTVAVGHRRQANSENTE